MKITYLLGNEPGWTLKEQDNSRLVFTKGDRIITFELRFNSSDPRFYPYQTAGLDLPTAKHACELLMPDNDSLWALLLERGFPLPTQVAMREAAIDAIDARYYAGPMVAGPWHIDDNGEWTREIIVSKPRSVGTGTQGAWEWNCIAAYVSDDGAYMYPVSSDQNIENDIFGPRYPSTEIELAKQWCDAQLIAHGWLLK